MNRATRVGGSRLPTGAFDAFREAASPHSVIGDHVREAAAFEGVGEVYQAIDRPNEAAKFYRQAAEEYREDQEWWRPRCAWTGGLRR